MTVNRTTLLDLPLPVTGTESGTWGDTTNNGLTQYMDIAIAGMSNLTSADFTAGALTIETTEGDSSATNISATSAQYAGFRVSSLAVNSTITVGNTGTSPARSYRLINADATYSLTFKATGQTGVTLLPGQSAVVAFNGTDYVIVGVVGAGSTTDNTVPRFDGTTGEILQSSGVTIDDSNNVSGVAQLNITTLDATNIEVTNIKAKDGTAAASIADSTGIVTVTAAPVMSALTASQAVFTTAGKALTSNAITGTGNVVMSASPTLTGTIAGASLQLSSLTSGRVTYAGASGLLQDSANLLYSGTDLTVYGITVGRGAGAVSSNTAVGASALAANTSGSQNTAVGSQSAQYASTATNITAIGYQAANSATGDGTVAVGTSAAFASTGADNTAMGAAALLTNSSGAYNTAIGRSALRFNTTASNNTAVGYQAGYSNTTGEYNTFIGWSAGYSSAFSGSGGNTAIGAGAGQALTTGVYNTFIGPQGQVSNGSGGVITSGSKNTILGGYNGNQGGLDIRTASNYIVLSDGDGNPLISTADNQTVALEGAVPNSGTGITFPATQAASSNANTLDDYEEGTWVVTFTPDTSGSITLNGSHNEMSYIKIGSQVTIFGRVLVASVSSPVGEIRINMPFAPETGLADQSDFYAMPIMTHDVDLSAGALTVFGESSGTNYFVVYQTVDNANWTILPSQNLKGNGNEYFYVTGSYRAA
jgi:hypothetical protein